MKLPKGKRLEPVLFAGNQVHVPKGSRVVHLLADRPTSVWLGVKSQRKVAWIRPSVIISGHALSWIEDCSVIWVPDRLLNQLL